MKSGAETFGGEPRVPLSGERGGGCGVRRRQTFFTVSVVLISAPPSCGNPTTWNSAAKTEIGWLSSSPNEIFAVPPAQAEEEATSVGADIIAPGAYESTKRSATGLLPAGRLLMAQPST